LKKVRAQGNQCAAKRGEGRGGVKIGNVGVWSTAKGRGNQVEVLKTVKTVLHSRGGKCNKKKSQPVPQKRAGKEIPGNAKGKALKKARGNPATQRTGASWGKKKKNDQEEKTKRRTPEEETAQKGAGVYAEMEGWPRGK